MKYCYIPLLVFAVSSCSLRTLAPTGLAIVGGGAGSVMGPMGGALGAGGGAALGQIIKGEGDVREAKEETKEVLKAISEGDVQKLIEIQAGEQKGIFDKIVDGIYRVLWLGGVCMVLWFVLPWIWARKHVKKAVEKHINGGTE